MNALIVFAKIPVPGQVKTRLTTAISEADAAQLYAAFLRDALVQYQALPVDVRLYLAPSDTVLPEDLVPEGMAVFTQEGGDLGARMQHAFLETFAQGYERNVIIGTDHPTLPTAFIAHAFEALVEPFSISIGPSEDGGYYLLGMNEFYPVLFRQMRYSHADVFGETLARVAETEAALTVLPPWYDVDTPEALRRLLQDLKAPGIQAAHTRRVTQRVPFK